MRAVTDFRGSDCFLTSLVGLGRILLGQVLFGLVRFGLALVGLVGCKQFCINNRNECLGTSLLQTDTLAPVLVIARVAVTR